MQGDPALVSAYTPIITSVIGAIVAVGLAAIQARASGKEAGKEAGEKAGAKAAKVETSRIGESDVIIGLASQLTELQERIEVHRHDAEKQRELSEKLQREAHEQRELAKGMAKKVDTLMVVTLERDEAKRFNKRLSSRISELEKEIAAMEQRISELQSSHSGQLSEMRSRYEQQIADMSAELGLLKARLAEYGS